MVDRSFICRCEDVTVHEIDQTLARGLTDIEEIKRYTGLGTGPCQGKECVATLCRWLLERGVITPASLQPLTARPPTEPVCLATLAATPRDEDPT